jgi:protein-ribulosamine 3-kinase
VDVSGHPLRVPVVLRAIEHAASDHVGGRWRCTDLVDLSDRAAHPCGLLQGEDLSLFAKLAAVADVDQFRAELRGLELIRRLAGVTTPQPVGPGVVVTDGWSVFLTVALPERPRHQRSVEDWRAIGRTLAQLHQTTAARFGLDHLDGYFGPLRQDNRPVEPNRWVDFYVERRVRPHLRAALDARHLPSSLATRVEQLLLRLPALAGSEPQPALLHGDAQQNNFISTPSGAVALDVAPYFGHPELDLALVDYFEPVSDELFAGYRELARIDPGFVHRREFWRIFAYLAVIAVDGATEFGRAFVSRLDVALRQYE